MEKGNYLFLVAGFRAAGKSTLLRHALTKRLAIFGEEFDTFFQKTKFPCKSKEYQMTLEEALNCGSWLTYNHIAPLSTLHRQPVHTTVHLDFLSLVQQTDFCSGKSPAEIVSHFSEKKNAYKFMDRAIQYLDDYLFRNYEHVLVNTIFTPWDIIRSRLVNRKYPEFSFSSFISGPSNSGEIIHRLFYEAWHHKINLIKPRRNIVSEYNGTAIFIRSALQEKQP